MKRMILGLVLISIEAVVPVAQGEAEHSYMLYPLNTKAVKFPMVPCAPYFIGIILPGQPRKLTFAYREQISTSKVEIHWTTIAMSDFIIRSIDKSEMPKVTQTEMGWIFYLSDDDRAVFSACLTDPPTVASR